MLHRDIDGPASDCRRWILSCLAELRQQGKFDHRENPDLPALGAFHCGMRRR